MRIDVLPSPGSYSGSHKLVQVSATFIGYAELADMYRRKGSGPSEDSVKLYKFFLACAEQVRPLAERELIESTPKAPKVLKPKE